MFFFISPWILNNNHQGHFTNTINSISTTDTGRFSIKSGITFLVTQRRLRSEYTATISETLCKLQKVAFVIPLKL